MAVEKLGLLQADAVYGVTFVEPHGSSARPLPLLTFNANNTVGSALDASVGRSIRANALGGTFVLFLGDN